MIHPIYWCVGAACILATRRNGRRRRLRRNHARPAVGFARPSGYTAGGVQTLQPQPDPGPTGPGSVPDPPPSYPGLGPASGHFERIVYDPHQFDPTPG
jgi:hypothetical protein